MRPEVSIVIPSYERAAETLRAVRSALAQGGVEAEVVVVDDASPTPLVLPADLAGAPRLRLLRLTRNGGAAAARNAGVAAAAADHLAFLDSDDFFLPDTLAARLRWFREREDGRPLLCACAVWRWRPGADAILAQPAPAADLGRLAAGCWYFPGSTALLHRSTFATVGPLDPALRRLEDLDWGVRLGKAGGALVSAPVAGAVVRRSPPAGRPAVDAAAAAIEARYAPPAAAALRPDHARRLRAYLALERAAAARGAGAYPRFAAEMLRSLLLRPRLSVHQHAWWTERPASATELARIEALAREFGGRDERGA